MSAILDPSAGVYLHGGPAGLGRVLLPPARTGVRSTGTYLTPAEQLAGGVSTGHVYVTTWLAGAQAYACAHRAPCVYVVYPLGELEPDPDWHGPPGISMRCTSARVLARLTVEPARRAELARLLERLAS